MDRGDATLVHGLSNLNLFDAQSVDEGRDGGATASSTEIAASAAAALAGMEPVLDTLREVRFFRGANFLCHLHDRRHPAPRFLQNHPLAPSLAPSPSMN